MAETKKNKKNRATFKLEEETGQANPIESCFILEHTTLINLPSPNHQQPSSRIQIEHLVEHGI